MKIHFWRGKYVTNFGDELNGWMWPRLLGDLVDDDASELLVGIGTVLNHRLPKARRTIVFGAGAGYGDKPRMNGWKIYCVRGPATAATLGLSQRLAVTDPGVLAADVARASARPRARFGFMPHWINANAVWENAAAAEGFLYVDPRGPVRKAIDGIAQVECLVTEALHGAIVADSLGIPWIQVIDAKNRDNNPFKWDDWRASLGIEANPLPLGKKLGEIARAGRPALSERARMHAAKRLLRERLDELRADLRAPVAAWDPLSAALSWGSAGFRVARAAAIGAAVAATPTVASVEQPANAPFSSNLAP